MKSTGEPHTRFRVGCSAARRTRLRRRPPFRWPCHPAPSRGNLTPCRGNLTPSSATWVPRPRKP